MHALHAPQPSAPLARPASTTPPSIAPSITPATAGAAPASAAGTAVPDPVDTQVVEDRELIKAVERLVAKLAAKSPLVLRRMKALVDDGLEQPSATALRLEILASEVHAHSHDMKEGLAAFEEKRKPHFIGR